MMDEKHQVNPNAELADSSVSHENTNQRLCVLTTREDLPFALNLNQDLVIRRFDESQELTQVATSCRIELMHLIREKSPESLYELAKLVNKNQAYIYREAKVLRELGLIEFESELRDGRRRVRPVALYDGVLLWI